MNFPHLIAKTASPGPIVSVPAPGSWKYGDFICKIPKKPSGGGNLFSMYGMFILLFIVCFIYRLFTLFYVCVHLFAKSYDCFNEILHRPLTGGNVGGWGTIKQFGFRVLVLVVRPVLLVVLILRVLVAYSLSLLLLLPLYLALLHPF